MSIPPFSSTTARSLSLLLPLELWLRILLDKLRRSFLRSFMAYRMPEQTADCRIPDLLLRLNTLDGKRWLLLVAGVSPCKELFADALLCGLMALPPRLFGPKLDARSLPIDDHSDNPLQNCSSKSLLLLNTQSTLFVT